MSARTRTDGADLVDLPPSVPAADAPALPDSLPAHRLAVLSQLASAMAHDFSNLLMGVEGCIDVSLNKLDADHAARKYLQEAKRSLVSGALMSRQLLMVSRQHKGVLGPQHLDKAVEGTLEFLRRRIATNLELDFLPAAPESRILFPEGALEEILLHLVLMARDALPQGGLLSFESDAATVREHEEPWQAGVPCGNYLTLRISDEGLGGFADATENGPGVAAACALIKHSGGYVDLTRTPELATVLTLYLPCANATPTELFDPGLSESAVPSVRPAAFILIVDDEPMIRMSLRSLLERIGYGVLEAHDGAAALTLCRQQRSPIDVLLTDVILPGIHGVQLAREVQALRPETAVLFMSAYPLSTLVRDGRLEPGMMSLQKPFDESTLAAALRQALSTRNAGNQLTRAS